MELQVLKDIYFIGTEDAINAFIATLKPRCIKPTTETIEENGHAVKLIFNSDNDTFISPTMRTYKKCPHCGRIEPEDSFRTVQIAQPFRRIPEGRRRRVAEETVCSHCIVDSIPLAEPIQRDDLYLVKDAFYDGYLYADDSRVQWFLGNDSNRYFFSTSNVNLNNHGIVKPAYLDADGRPHMRTWRELTGSRFNGTCKYAREEKTVEVHSGHLVFRFLRTEVGSDNEHFERCPHCGTWHIRANHEVEAGMCTTCANVQIWPYHGWNGELQFKKTNNEEDDVPFFGTEVETEGSESNSRCVTPYQDIWHLEHDGSLLHGRSFEMISQPMTWGFLQTQKENIEKMFKSLCDAGQTSNDSARCGLHVHVSASAFNSEEAIQRAVIIVNAFKQNMELFARRRGTQYCSYSGNFDYAHVQRILEDIDDIYGTIDTYGHGVAVNVANHHSSSRKDTIEFRIFKGTLVPLTYFAAIEFVKNIVEVANSGKNQVRFRDLIYGEYVPRYVEERTNKYGAAFDMDAVIDFGFANVAAAFKNFVHGSETAKNLVLSVINYAESTDSLSADDCESIANWVSSRTAAADNSDDEFARYLHEIVVGDSHAEETGSTDISSDTSVTDEPVVIPFAR